VGNSRIYILNTIKKDAKPAGLVLEKCFSNYWFGGEVPNFLPLLILTFLRVLRMPPCGNPK
jgi:hypothetical protein